MKNKNKNSQTNNKNNKNTSDCGNRGCSSEKNRETSGNQSYDND